MYNKEYLNLKIQVNMYLETKDTERFNLIHQDMKSIISDFIDTNVTISINTDTIQCISQIY